MLSFDSEIALVTGAGGGLGRAYAHALAMRGAHVVVNDLGAAAHETVEQILASGGQATVAIGSVFEDAERIVEAARSITGQLDIVINNAGVSGGGAFHEMPSADWERIFAVHLHGTVNVSRAAWPLLARSKAGRILNTSSAAIFGAPFVSHYAAAKGAIFSFTRSWAGEGIASCIRVNCVLPSAFTPMTAQIADPAFRTFLTTYFAAEPVAEFATWLLHRDCRVTGEAFEVGGDRAARVVLAEAPGVFLPGGKAENWLGQEKALLDLQGIKAPASMMDEVALQVENMSLEVRKAFAAIDHQAGWN